MIQLQLRIVNIEYWLSQFLLNNLVFLLIVSQIHEAPIGSIKTLEDLSLNLLTDLASVLLKQALSGDLDHETNGYLIGGAADLEKPEVTVQMSWDTFALVVEAIIVDSLDFKDGHAIVCQDLEDTRKLSGGH